MHYASATEGKLFLARAQLGHSIWPYPDTGAVGLAHHGGSLSGKAHGPLGTLLEVALLLRGRRLRLLRAGDHRARTGKISFVGAWLAR